MSPVSAFPSFATILEGADDDDEVNESVTTCAAAVSVPNLFTADTLFPSVITQLQYTEGTAHNTHTENGLTVFGSHVLSQHTRPFDTCPKVAFALTMIAAPYLAVPIKSLLNLIIMQYQHDNYFKFTFSELFMYLYPAMHALYLRFIGTEKQGRSLIPLNYDLCFHMHVIRLVYMYAYV